MRFLPVFLDLQTGPVLLVGAGDLARAKLRLLAAAGARIRWFATDGHHDVSGLAAADAARIELAEGDPLAADLRGVIAIGRVPANTRARRRQQAHFRSGQLASSDKQHGAGLQVEKHRQESHATLASPTYGVDWNYFLYMSHSEPAKRNLFLLYCSATIEFSPSKAKG